MKTLLAILILAAPLGSQSSATPSIGNYYWRTETPGSADPTTLWGLPGPYSLAWP